MVVFIQIFGSKKVRSLFNNIRYPSTRWLTNSRQCSHLSYAKPTRSRKVCGNPRDNFHRVRTHYRTEDQQYVSSSSLIDTPRSNMSMTILSAARNGSSPKPDQNLRTTDQLPDAHLAPAYGSTHDLPLPNHHPRHLPGHLRRARRRCWHALPRVRRWLDERVLGQCEGPG